jgi:hypothetical protein
VATDKQAVAAYSSPELVGGAALRK